MFSYEDAVLLLQEGLRMKNTAREDVVIFIDGTVVEVDGILQTIPTMMSLNQNDGLISELILNNEDRKAIWEIIKVNS
ncbi:TPA: hypothetical protein KNH08_002132 [Serratia fonticola]|nr:hypothetical protein [Serratia fonticola]